MKVIAELSCFIADALVCLIEIFLRVNDSKKKLSISSKHFAVFNYQDCRFKSNKVFIEALKFSERHAVAFSSFQKTRDENQIKFSSSAL